MNELPVLAVIATPKLMLSDPPLTKRPSVTVVIAPPVAVNVPLSVPPPAFSNRAPRPTGAEMERWRARRSG